MAIRGPGVFQALFLLSILLIASTTTHEFAFAQNFTGKVIGVLDGDTIEVLHTRHAERIRLNGIDCPEKGQAYGKRAKQAASALVFRKEVTLQTFGKDKYGRTIADVLLPECFYQMAQTSTTNSSRTAGAGGIGSMRPQIQGWRCWRQ